MAGKLEWPELDEMTAEQMRDLIEDIRTDLVYCEDAHDFALGLAEKLQVDLSV